MGAFDWESWIFGSPNRTRNPKTDFLEKDFVSLKPILDFAFYWEIRNPDLKIQI